MLMTEPVAAAVVVAGSYAAENETAAVGASPVAEPAAAGEIAETDAKRAAGIVQDVVGHSKLAEHAELDAVAVGSVADSAGTEHSAVASAYLLDWPAERTLELDVAGSNPSAAASCAVAVSPAADALALAFFVAAAASAERAAA